MFQFIIIRKTNRLSRDQIRPILTSIKNQKCNIAKYQNTKACVVEQQRDSERTYLALRAGLMELRPDMAELRMGKAESGIAAESPGIFFCSLQRL